MNRLIIQIVLIQFLFISKNFTAVNQPLTAKFGANSMFDHFLEIKNRYLKELITINILKGDNTITHIILDFE